MANDWDITARNAMLNAFGALCTKIACHTDDPGAANSATNEITGGTYARQSITWAAADSGAMSPSNEPAFDIGAGQTVSWISGWNTAGNVRYFKKNVTDEAFGAAGTYTLLDETVVDLNGA